MEKQHYRFELSFSIVISLVISLGLVAFVSCIAAELKRAKKEDIKLDGRLCYLPENRAFGFGVAALICLCIAQIIGNSIVCTQLCSTRKRNGCNAKTQNVARCVGVLSWISFGIAIILMSGATSMSRRQPYGKGWLEGECYMVKSGVYSVSAILIVITLSCTLVSAALTKKMNQVHPPHTCTNRVKQDNEI